MATSSLFSNLISALTTAAGSLSPATITSAVTNVFSNHFSGLQNIITQLQTLGPGANTDELDGLLTSLINQSVQTSGTPTSEFALISVLKTLVGKTDAQSLVLWSQLCAQMSTALNNASTSLLGGISAAL